MIKRITPEQLVLDHIAAIKKHANDFLEEWEAKTIPMETVKIILDKGKMHAIDGTGLTRKTRVKVNKMRDNFNSLLDGAYGTMNVAAIKVQVKGIPVAYFNLVLGTIEKGYKS